MRDTKVCSESVLESLEGHLKLQTLKHIYQKYAKMSPIKLEPTDRKNVKSYR